MNFRQEIRSSRTELKFPSFRMSDGLRFTDSHTRCWFCTIARSARSAAILDLLALLLFHKCDGFFAEDVNLVRTHLEDFGRTDFRALAATIALVRVDGDIPVARAVLKTIIGYHVISAKGQRLKAGGQIFCLKPQASNLKRSDYAFLALFALPIFNRAFPNRAAPMPPAI